MKIVYQIYIIFLTFLIFAPAKAQDKNAEFLKNLTYHYQPVNDMEDVFTDAEEEKLTALLATAQTQAGAEIVIVTITPDLVRPDYFDDFTLLMANRYRIGKDKSNGILIAISAGHRMIRIQNGHVIETRMSDMVTKKIIDEIFVPYFKSGNYIEGTYIGIKSIVEYLEANP